MSLPHDMDVVAIAQPGGAAARAVLRAVAPTGPVVLVGHSMGAMTALVYARQNPGAIGTRIVGRKPSRNTPMTAVTLPWAR